MNTLFHAVQLGLIRGWIEFKQSMTNGQDITWTIIMNAILVIVLVFQRNSMIEGFPLALFTVASLLGMSIAMGGLTGTAGLLSADREDGTLLRAKAIPQGMVGYLVSRIMIIALSSLLGVVIMLVAGLFLVDGITDMGLSGILLIAVFFVIGLLATLPWGAIVGSLVKSSGSGFGLTFLFIGGLGAISGIFYPITALAGWLQAIGQIFPVYWLGHGMRLAVLPDAAAAAEIGGTWRPTQALIMLAIWAILGLCIAPRVLRRMARHESGSTVEARKQQIMQRGY